MGEGGLGHRGHLEWFPFQGTTSLYSVARYCEQELNSSIAQGIVIKFLTRKGVKTAEVLWRLAARMKPLRWRKYMSGKKNFRRMRSPRSNVPLVRCLIEGNHCLTVFEIAFGIGISSVYHYWWPWLWKSISKGPLDFSQMNRNNYFFWCDGGCWSPTKPNGMFSCNGSLPARWHGLIIILQKEIGNYGVEKGQNLALSWQITHMRFLYFRDVLLGDYRTISSANFCEFLDKQNLRIGKREGVFQYEMSLLVFKCQTSHHTRTTEGFILDSNRLVTMYS